MKARIPTQFTSNQKKAIDIEIKKQIAELDKEHALETDAMILWILYSEFGFREQRLKKFHDIFVEKLDELVKYYEMGDADMAWLCARKLKDDAGIDILKWSKED